MRRKLGVGSNVVVPFIMLFLFAFLVSGCAGPTTVADLVPNTFSTNVTMQKVEGSVNVRTSVPPSTSNPTFKSMDVSDWIDSKKLKEAIEKSILQKGIFSEVSQGQADYVLDVWVDKIQNMLEITGEGFIFDLTSVWRLTRTKDGNVVVCEFVKGHGAARGFASRAYPPSVSAATRDMLQKGLFAVSDQSQSHLSALSTAEHRAAISSANK
jgi:hypothetical protein